MKLLSRVTRYEVLDSFRGISAILVILYHLHPDNGFLQREFISGSYIFVDFFFVLSGFVISLNYANRITTKDGFKIFLIRRFFRLLPLHIFLLMIYFVVELGQMAINKTTVFGGISGRTFDDFLRTLFLTNSFGMGQGTFWNAPSWSISAEWWTYVAFGILVLLLRRGGTLRAGLLFLSFAGFAVVAMTSQYMGDAVADYGIFRCFYGFSLGAVLASLWPRVSAVVERLGDHALGVAELLLLAAVFLFVDRFYRSPVSFAAPLLFLLVVAVFALERGPVSKLLRAGPFLRAGVLSYSIYMVHQLVIGRVRNATELVSHFAGVNIETAWPIYPLLQILAVLIVVWIVSGFTYRFVELPGQAFGARIIVRMRQRKEAV